MTKHDNTILIPELEEEAIRIDLSTWTPKDKEILKTYYTRVTLDSLMKYIPGKTQGSIRNMAQRMGLTRRKKP